MAFSEETIQQVWEKATPVAGNDPAVWRQDQCKAWAHPINQGENSLIL